MQYMDWHDLVAISDDRNIGQATPVLNQGIQVGAFKSYQPSGLYLIKPS
jgi:hypothetical protein